MKGLTLKERRFVAAYLGAALGNGAKAAIIAGYSARTATAAGSRLLRSVKVRAAVESGAERKALEAEVPAKERDRIIGGILLDVTQEARDRLRAADLLNKAEGRYIQRHEISGRLTLEQALGAVDEELKAEAAAKAART